MPNLLDYKDSKNIIIYLFAGLLILAGYVYQNDKADAEKSTMALEKVVIKECSTIHKAIAGIVNDQKEMRREMRVMAVDVATMKVLKNLKDTK